MYVESEVGVSEVMSDRQRLITKYLNRLSRPVATAYYLFFLESERDEGALHMIYDALQHTAEQTHNSGLLKATQNKRKRDWVSYVNGQLEVSSVDREQVPHMLLSSLLLEQALERFTKLKRREKRNYRKSATEKWPAGVPQSILAYRQRAEINLVMGNYPEALELARKGNLKDIMFVAAICSKNLEVALELLPSMFRLVEIRPDQVSVSVVSAYETLHLIIFVSLAVHTCREVKQMLKQVNDASNYELNELVELASTFAERRFADFTRMLPTLEHLLNLSMYTSTVSDWLVHRTKLNIVRNVAVIYSRVTIGELSEMTVLPSEEVTELLYENILEQRLIGKLDLVDGCFIGTEDATQIAQMQSMMNEAIALDEALHRASWRREYISTTTSKQDTKDVTP